jgi:hypothetical protein
MIDAGAFSTKLTFRLTTSKDRNWYINTTPLVAVPCIGDHLFYYLDDKLGIYSTVTDWNKTEN